jgi:probable F420-dependent oxidoreductase
VTPVPSSLEAPVEARYGPPMTSPAILFPSRLGVWWQTDYWHAREALSVARDVEALGYGSFFFPEGAGKDSLIQASVFLAATHELVVGTGIANIYLRNALAAEGAGRTLTALYPGRFVLGLGVSHASTVEGRFGQRYGPPLATMRGYLERMEDFPADVEPGAGRPPRLLAAFGPKMLQLAAGAADGVHPYLVTPEQTRTTREAVGPDKWVVTELAMALGGDKDDPLRRAKNHLQFYLQMPNYRESWLRQGFDDSDFEGGGSERLVRSLVATGSGDDVVKAVFAHLEAGADHVVVQPLGDNARTQ